MRCEGPGWRVPVKTSKVIPTVHTMMVERVPAETIIVMMSSMAVKISASVEIMEGVRSSEAVIQVACKVLEEKGNHCSTRGVRSEELTG